MDPIILTAAFALGYLVYRLGLPPLVGFLLADLGLSAFGVETSPLLQSASDVGVTLLLFTIGLKLKIKSLLKPEVWAGGVLHIGLTVSVLGFALFCLGYSGMRFFLGMDLNTALLLAFGAKRAMENSTICKKNEAITAFLNLITSLLFLLSTLLYWYPKFQLI